MVPAHIGAQDIGFAAYRIVAVPALAADNSCFPATDQTVETVDLAAAADSAAEKFVFAVAAPGEKGSERAGLAAP